MLSNSAPQIDLGPQLAGWVHYVSDLQEGQLSDPDPGGGSDPQQHHIPLAHPAGDGCDSQNVLELSRAE